MTLDPASLRNLSNDPSYQAALNDITQLESSGDTQISVIVNDLSAVYENPQIPEKAKDALVKLVQNIFSNPSANIVKGLSDNPIYQTVLNDITSGHFVEAVKRAPEVYKNSQIPLEARQMLYTFLRNSALANPDKSADYVNQVIEPIMQQLAPEDPSPIVKPIKGK